VTDNTAGRHEIAARAIPEGDGILAGKAPWRQTGQKGRDQD